MRSVPLRGWPFLLSPNGEDMQPTMQLQVPITKIDIARREVYGVAALEQPDHSGEVFDYATSRPYFQEWTSAFEKRTGGKSKGNVRAMHKDIAAGKLVALNFNDAQRQIEVGAKVVDDAEWKKVE